MTVSRALRQLEGVSEAKRAEIVRIADELGYVPDSSARSLSQSTSNLIGISVPTLFDDVFADMLAGMRSTFRSAGFQTIMDIPDYDERAEREWVERVLSWRPAGIILTGEHADPELRRRIREQGVPTLEIWDHGPDPIDLCVGIDHFGAGDAIGRHVASLGYVRPAFVGAPHLQDPRAELRLRGVSSAFGKPVGVSIATARPPQHNSFEAGRQGTLELLGQPDLRPDVIFYLNDHLAFGGLMACRSLGLDSPGDIGIVGFNGLDVTKVMPVALTTVVTPRRRMGVLSASNLLARIKGVKVARTVCMPVEIVDGGTTRRIGP